MNALFFSLLNGIQFFLSNRNVCFVKRFFWYAHDEQSLSRLFLLLNCTSSFFWSLRRAKKAERQQRESKSCCACVRLNALSLFSLSFLFVFQSPDSFFRVSKIKRKRFIPTVLPQKVIVPDAFSHSVKELIVWSPERL